jgi:hypothetical protein
MKKYLALSLVGIAAACGPTATAVRPAPAPVDECPGRPGWTCMGGAGPCSEPVFAGKICSVGIATGLSENLGMTTAGAAARGEIAKFMEATVETFNSQMQAARTQGDATEEVSKVQAGLKQLASRKLQGVATPKRYYDPATRTTYVIAVMDTDGFAAAIKAATQAAKLSEEARRRIDKDAEDVEFSWKNAKDEAKQR